MTATASNTELDLLRKENAMLRYRVMAAELALYQVGDALRSQSAHADAVVRKVHELNAQFPLGDADLDGVQNITIQAIRASVPGAADLTPAEVKARFLSPINLKEVPT